MNKLISAIRDRNVILFAGAGVSMNLGLPSFRQLVEYMGDQVGYDPDVYTKLGNFLALAEYYRIKKGSLKSLCRWMDRTWHNKKVDIAKSTIHKHIVDLRFPLIYTTNYDRWIELAFKHHKQLFHKVANVADTVNIPNDITQIVKFHGDFDDVKSIVLTESSYFERLGFEAPLDIKLRADAQGKSLLFIGYSLEDVNMRLLLYKLHKQWDSTVYRDARPHSYIFLSKPNPVQEAILDERGITPIPCDADTPAEGLELFLRNLVKQARRKA